MSYVNWRQIESRARRYRQNKLFRNVLPISYSYIAILVTAIEACRAVRF
jgi:hypothetical protein